MIRHGAVASALALLCFVAVASEARATVVVLHGLEEMTRKSEVIVHARVAAQRVQKEEGRIVTLTDIEVLDGLKGAKVGETLTIYQVGGSLDGARQWIEGAHEYEIGEEMVLFAVRHKERIVSYGVGVGKFRVIYDGAFRRVVEDLHGVVEMKRSETGEVSMGSPVPRTFPSLEALKQEVRAYVARGDLPRVMKNERRAIGPAGKAQLKPAPKSVEGGR